MTEPLSLAAYDIRVAHPKSDFALEVERVEIPAGSSTALLGPSGSGKTTLLEVLALLRTPESGRVELGGRPVDEHNREARLAMAAVFQRPYLFKGSVGGNVGWGLAARGVPKAERPPRIAAALERVGLAGWEARSALSLSGGEAQRVSLARALVLEPRVLLLDEPLASLDVALKRRLAREFADILGQSGATVVWVTHDQDEALIVAERIAILDHGRLVSEGPSEEVMGLPGDEWTASFLGVEAPTSGVVTRVGEGTAEVTVDGGVLVQIPGTPPPGTRVRFAVRPEDVLLFESDVDLPATSARNRLVARVEEVSPLGTMLAVTLDANGVRLAASVSRAAYRELHLEPGREVLAVFKASAVRWSAEHV